MENYSVCKEYQEEDPCFVTKLGCNNEIVGALVQSVDSYVRIFGKDLDHKTTLTSPSGLTDICFFREEDNGLVGGTYDGLVKIWDIRTPAPVRSMQIGQDEILSVAVGAKDSLIACAVENNVVVTDVRMEGILHTLCDHTDVVTSLGFHPIRDDVLVSTGEDGLCVIRNMENIEDIHPFVVGDTARSFTFAGPERDLLCMLGASEQVTTFNVDEEEFGLKTLASDIVRETPLLQDGDSKGFIVAVFYEDWVNNVLTLGGSSSGRLLLFDSDNAVVATFSPHHEGVVRSALSIKKNIWTCGEDGKIALWKSLKESIEIQATHHVERRPRTIRRNAPY